MWLTATQDAIKACECESGCPSCVQSPKCGNKNNLLDKDAAVTLIDVLLKDARELMNTGNSSATAPTAQTSGESPAQPPGPENAFRLQVSETRDVAELAAPSGRFTASHILAAGRFAAVGIPAGKETPLTGRARSLDRRRPALASPLAAPRNGRR